MTTQRSVVSWDLATFIRAVKANLGLSQWDICKALDLQPSYITAILSGEKRPYPRFNEHILLACQAFRLTLPTVLRMGGMTDAEIEALMGGSAASKKSLTGCYVANGQSLRPTGMLALTPA